MNGSYPLIRARFLRIRRKDLAFRCRIGQVPEWIFEKEQKGGEHQNATDQAGQAHAQRSVDICLAAPEKEQQRQHQRSYPADDLSQ